MTIQILGIFTAILFLAICYLHSKVIFLTKKLKQITLIVSINTFAITGWVQMLISKGLISQKDIDEFTATGKISPVPPVENIHK